MTEEFTTAPRLTGFPGSHRIAQQTNFQMSRPREPRRIRRAMAAALVLGASVSGCAVDPDYTAPATHLAPFHNEPTISAENSARPRPRLDTWWTGFKEPMLVTVVQRALDEESVRKSGVKPPCALAPAFVVAA